MALENIRMYGNIMQYLYDNNGKDGLVLRRSDFKDAGGKFDPHDVEYFWDYDVERLRRRFDDELIDEVMYGWPSLKTYDASTFKSNDEIISVTKDFNSLFYDEMDHVSSQLQDISVEEMQAVLGLYDHLKNEGLDFDFEITDFDIDDIVKISITHHRLNNPKTVYFEILANDFNWLNKAVVQGFSYDSFVKDLNKMKELGVPLEASFNGDIAKIAKDEENDIRNFIQSIREYGEELDMKTLEKVYDHLNPDREL